MKKDNIELDEESIRWMFHVFSDGYGDYFIDYDEALEDYKRLKKEGYSRGRLYKIGEYYNKNGEPTGNFANGNCLESFGPYPS